MDATLRDKAAEFAKEFALNISTPQELSDVMRLMSKSMIERMLQAEMDVHLSEDGAARIAQGVATAAAKDRTTETAAETSSTRSPRASVPAAIAATAFRPRPCKANRDG